MKSFTHTPEPVLQSLWPDLYVSLTHVLMAALAPWDHPSCPPTNLGFRTYQEVLSHASILWAMVIIIVYDAPELSGLLYAIPESFKVWIEYLLLQLKK